MRKGVSAVLFCAVLAVSVVPVRLQAAHQATIEPETKARLVLQSHINSKLNEAGDSISATLDAPLQVNGELVLPRGTEFVGRVTEATPAGRGQKNGKIAIIFDKIRMPWGEVPVAVGINAIDDWSSNEKMKSDDEGEVKGNRSGKRTAENVERGGTIGAAGGLATVLLGGGGAAAGGVIAGGLLGGLLLTKGGDVRVAPGLEMGADDYMPKPFNPRELIARIRAILRRARLEPGEASTSSSPERLSLGDVELDKGTRIVTRGGEQLTLTALEFDLLEALIRSAGHIVTREELVKSILGRSFTPYDRSIDTHVSNLRKKLGHHVDGVERIKTIRGVGYIYAKPVDKPKE